MLVQIVTENGQKKVIPLTADAGAGLPVGTVIAMYKKSNPSGFLYLDGRDTTGMADELSTNYPLLYAYLGSNVLPDYREFALVGAEQNTTDVYNASTNPNGTIRTHDVYTEGQAKDDQLQTHSHNTYVNGDTDHPFKVANGYVGRDTSGWGFDGSTFNLVAMGNRSGRMGSVTRGKRKAVYFYIKATSGLSENAQDNVVAQLNEERSYSTSEVNTGKKWIDGKPIYSKVIITEDFTPYNGNTFAVVHTDVSQLNIDRVIQIGGTIRRIQADGYNSDYAINSSEASNYYTFCKWEKSASFNRLALIVYFYGGQSTKGYITLEYTKTTD